MVRDDIVAAVTARKLVVNDRPVFSDNVQAHACLARVTLSPLSCNAVYCAITLCMALLPHGLLMR